VRELDARKAFAALRERFAAAIEELFARIMGGGSAQTTVAAQDRQVMHDLLDLAPPGVDELVAIIEITEALPDDAGRRGTFDLVVIDTAPTGHALRLIEMPSLVHDWVKAVMAILLKYQPVVGVGDLGAVLLRLSQGLGRVRAMLTDGLRTQFIVVTRPAALPRAETVRLLARLNAASVPVPAVVVNAVGAGTCSRCRRDRSVQQKEIAALRKYLPVVKGRASLILTGAALPPPLGWRPLRDWRRTWVEDPG
jgi:arsenite-transporting ATPase